MPAITDIPANAIVHSAIMSFRVSASNRVELEPGPITVLREDPDNLGNTLLIGTAVYSTVTKLFIRFAITFSEFLWRT